VVTRDPEPNLSQVSDNGDLLVRGPQKKKASNLMKMFNDDEDDDFLVKKAPQKVEQK
jgi:hypothetical protein